MLLPEVGDERAGVPLQLQYDLTAVDAVGPGGILVHLLVIWMQSVLM